METGISAMDTISMMSLLDVYVLSLLWRCFQVRDMKESHKPIFDVEYIKNLIKELIS